MQSPLQHRRRPSSTAARGTPTPSDGSGGRGYTEGRRRRKRGKLPESCLFFSIAVASTFVMITYSVAKVILPRLFPLKLPVANVDIAVPSVEEFPLIHIVNTRFMQFQGSLTTLAMARLYQFLTFCLPSMVHQSTQDFFWIIKTDPAFTTTDVFRKLLDSVRAYPNIYVVASNTNFFIHPDQKGSWRDGAEGIDLLSSKVYSGDMFKLKQAMALRNERPVLETRLDADDGLHNVYLETLQEVAKKRLSDSNHGRLNWLYWCPRIHFEWHPSSNSSAADDAEGPHPAGLLKPIRHFKLCITPGITVAFNVGVDSDTVPIHSHDLLYKAVHNSTACHNTTPIQSRHNAGSCLEFVEDPPVNAIRSRTWTSAGMLEVDVEGRSLQETEKAWQFLESEFHVVKEMAKETKTFLAENKRQIAYENLIGQCQGAHSCKESARAHLKKLADNDQIANKPAPVGSLRQNLWNS